MYAIRSYYEENDEAKPAEPYQIKKQIIEEQLRSSTAKVELNDAIAPESVVAMEYASYNFV